MIDRHSLQLPERKRGESGEIKEGAKVRIVMAKVRRKAVYTDIFLSVGAFDGDELPFFAVHYERILKGTEA